MTGIEYSGSGAESEMLKLLKEHLWRRAHYVAPEPLSRSSIRYFALAVGDENPLYTDREYAVENGFADIIAPPTMIFETNQYAPGPPNEDGFLGHDWKINVPNTRMIRGGNSYEILEPVYPSTRLSVEWEITDVSERISSNGGAMYILTSVAKYRDQNERLLGVNTETLIFQPLLGGPDAGN